MLKINKLADYGLVVMSCLARHAIPLNAPFIASRTHVAEPTVSKVLKALTKAGLLISTRGTQGGYRLARAPQKISLMDMLSVLDNDRAMTECAEGAGLCMVESYCGIRHNWKAINAAFFKSLSKITLADMLSPASQFKKRLSEI